MSESDDIRNESDKIGAVASPNGAEETEVVEPSDESRNLPSPEEVLGYARDDTLDFLEGLLEAMGLEGEVQAEVTEGAIRATVNGEDLGVLIGRHGRTLEAVQELLRAAVQRQAQTRVRLSLDIEGYQEGRRQVLEQHAQEMAEEALREGEARLEPMGAFERKIIHDAVSSIEGVTSESEGEEPNRRVVIRPIQD